MQCLAVHEGPTTRSRIVFLRLINRQNAIKIAGSCDFCLLSRARLTPHESEKRCQAEREASDCKPTTITWRLQRDWVLRELATHQRREEPTEGVERQSEATGRRAGNRAEIRLRTTRRLRFPVGSRQRK